MVTCKYRLNFRISPQIYNCNNIYNSLENYEILYEAFTELQVRKCLNTVSNFGLAKLST